MFFRCFLLFLLIFFILYPVGKIAEKAVCRKFVKKKKKRTKRKRNDYVGTCIKILLGIRSSNMQIQQRRISKYQVRERLPINRNTSHIFSSMSNCSLQITFIVRLFGVLIHRATVLLFANRNVYVMFFKFV